MQNALIGIQAAAPFDTLLEEWSSVVADYGAWWDWEKCCWWQRERPAVSIFSGAIWRVKGMLLEEGKAEKLGPVETCTYNGRCDLTFGLPLGKGNRINFEAEAKHVWCNLDRPVATSIRQSASSLEKAWRDSARLRHCENPLGILFVSFVITGAGKHVPDARRNRVKAGLRTWIDGYLKHFNDELGLALAWFVSTDERHIDCPGCAVLIRHEREGSHRPQKPLREGNSRRKRLQR